MADRVGGLPVSVAYRPAAGLAAGGDFYDAFELDDDRVAFMVGDVSGHGRDALSRTTLVHYTLRAYLDAGLEPRQVLGMTDQAIGEELGGAFATVVVATYEPSSGALTYASAGHPPPILSGPVDYEPVTELSSPPIGIGLLPTGRRQTTIRLPAACEVCLYTDGLIEAQVDGELLGRDRLAEMMAGLEAETAAQALIGAVHVEADDASDDMAACVFSTGRRAAGDGERLEELEVEVTMLDHRSTERFLETCGVPADEIPAAISHARDVAADAETAVLRIAIADGSAAAEAQPASVPALVAG
ncbi:MAG: serine/threonine-protein phosphatase [Thermoleophilaceae bacterium]|nr:serine/threonine-protein phosphatase [Thermoleophilaceae bacterium]